MAEVAGVAEEVEEVGVAEEQRQEEEQRPEEEMRNSSEQNRPPSMGIDKTSTDSSQIFKDTCL